MKDFNRKNLEYPCGYYAKNPEFDSFITHQHQLEDMKRAGEIGMEAYIREQVLLITNVVPLLLGTFAETCSLNLPQKGRKAGHDCLWAVA